MPALAWNSLGHRMAAELVWRQLDATERQAVTGLLKQHPHYQSILAAHVPAGVDKDEWVFLTAAIWPDVIRPVKGAKQTKPEAFTKYDIYPHVIHLPFVRAVDAGRVSLEGYTIDTPNAQTGLADSIARLGDPSASAADRAVSLCWVLHLGGDVHQPMHAAALVWPGNPRGENSGTSIAVREAGRDPIGLHVYWDRLPGEDTGYAAVLNGADALEKTPELAREKLAELAQATSVAAWVQESHQVALRYAYGVEGKKPANMKAFAAGKIPASAVPVLPPAYVKKAGEVAQRQLALAGWRLTEVLKRVW
ncbi:MAG: S1/P1 nuclease [Opitutae bacterium]|nr:S1/P1 nuclease [Opitutae bacterium]